jgi:hypothetical protein
MQRALYVIGAGLSPALLLILAAKTDQGAGLASIILKPTSCLHPSFAPIQKILDNVLSCIATASYDVTTRRSQSTFTDIKDMWCRLIALTAPEVGRRIITPE